MKKLLLLAILFLFVPLGVDAQITHIASTKSTAVGGVPQTTATINTTGATLLVAHIAHFGGTATITDSAANVWTAIPEACTLSIDSRLFYAINPKTSTLHTFASGGGSLYQGITVAAYSGTQFGQPLDQKGNCASINSTTLPASPVTPAQDNELVIATLAMNGAGTASLTGGFTIRQETSYVSGQSIGASLADLTQTTASTVSPTWTHSASTNLVARIFTFKKFGPINFVNRAEASGVATSLSTTAANHRAGNLLSLVVGWQTGTISSVTDTAGNTWNAIGTPVLNGCGANDMQMFYAYNIVGNEANQVTVTLSGSSNGFAIAVRQFEGFSTTDPFDSWAGRLGSGTDLTPGGFTVSRTAGLIHYEAIAGGAITTTDGYIGNAWGGSSLDAYKVVVQAERPAVSAASTACGSFGASYSAGSDVASVPPEESGAQFYKGTFAASTSIGGQTITGIVDDDGAPFLPKFVLLWGTKQTASGVTDGIATTVTVMDCTTAMTNFQVAQDNSITSNTWKASHNARAIDTYTDLGVNDSRATLASCASGEFGLNWSVASASAWVYHYVAIGGASVQGKAQIVSPGAADHTADSAPFVGTAGFMLTTGATAAGVEAVSAEAYGFGLGWYARQLATNGYQQALTNGCTSDNDALAVTGRWQSSARALASFTTSCASTFIAYSWQAQRGWIAANANDEDAFLGLVGGVQAKGGAGAQMTAPGADTTTIAGLGFTPKLVCVMSTGQTVDNVVENELRWTLGCATPDAQGHVWVGDLQAADITAAAQKTNTTDILSACTPNATGASTTCPAVANISAWGSDGVTLTWSAADATARQYHWIAFGSPDVAPASSGGARSYTF